MADPREVAERDGAHRTNIVTLEPGAWLNPDYECRLYVGEMTTTGHLKVIEFAPRNSDRSSPSFLGRWDEKTQALDFDLLDGRSATANFPGHHSKHLGERRFEVDISTPTNEAVFKGVVVVRLGFKMNAGTGHYGFK